ncbi:hypothetical protein [Bradyrhizobium sp. YR681]|uniref:hypothetical protein n=1 Tax=Bradyrhizobium sp. YR681 TaxID=1144344 RepID=UPI0012F6D7D6|nr:hypothetical protein [Bradyrhizobium sp. YR681]
MSSSFTSLLHVPTLVIAWIFTLVFAGGPLLWKFLNYRPVTRCALVQAVLNVVATGSWLTLGMAVIAAQEHGLISTPTSVLAMALLLAVAAGSSTLIARWCPDEQS